MRGLDSGIRQLKVQYDMFFAGALKREPIELRKRLQNVVQRYSSSPPGKYAEKFLLNSLTMRFNTMTELWAKNVRSREISGEQRHESEAERLGIKEQLITRCVVDKADRKDPNLERIHARFVEASRRYGHPEVPYDRFVRGVAAQTKKLRKTTDCGPIELRVIVCDEQVQLKARPSKARAAGGSE